MSQQLVNSDLLTLATVVEKSETLAAAMTEDEIDAVINAWLRRWVERVREREGITQNEVARRAGISGSDLSNALNQNMSLTTLMVSRIAATIGPRASVIYGEIAQMMAQAELRRDLGQPVVEQPVDMPGRRRGARAKAISAATPKEGTKDLPVAPAKSPEPKQPRSPDRSRTTPK
jgi:transcriptional regulator with XRE-family HTH domain